MNALHSLRREYTGKPFGKKDAGNDAPALFVQWLNEAISSGCDEPNAMCLSTTDRDSRPHSRIVLLKEVNQGTFVFFTNYHSEKGRQLNDNPAASLLFYWAPLFRQVRIEGHVQRVSSQTSQDYFNSRPAESRLSAIVSPQSEIIPNRNWLILQREQMINSKQELVCPPHWGGYMLIPERFEFWQGRPDRLHDRIVMVPDKQCWKANRLAP